MFYITKKNIFLLALSLALAFQSLAQSNKNLQILSTSYDAAQKTVYIRFNYLEDGSPASGLKVNDLVVKYVNDHSVCPPDLIEENTGYTLKICPDNKTQEERAIKLLLFEDSTITTNYYYYHLQREAFIYRTAETFTLSNEGVTAGTDTEFCFTIYDSFGKEPEAAKLYLLDVNGNDTANFDLSKSNSINSNESNWCVTIPGTRISGDMLDYRVEAAFLPDYLITFPNNTIEHSYISIPVDLQMPTDISILSENIAPTCNDYSLKVKIESSSLNSLNVYYREKGAPSYQTINAEQQTLTDTLSFVIPVSSDIEYFIQTEDNNGVITEYGSRFNPEIINKTDPRLAGFVMYKPSMRLTFARYIVNCERMKKDDKIKAYFMNDCGKYTLGGQVIFDPTTGPVNTTSFTIYSNDSSTAVKDGFVEGERVYLEIERDGISYPLPVDSLKFSDTWADIYDFNVLTKYDKFLSGLDWNVIENEDMSPNLEDGTDFGKVIQEETHGFSFYNSSCINLDYSSPKIENSPNNNFEVTIRNDSLFVTYLAEQKDSAWVVVNASDSSRIIFKVRGDIKPCSTPAVYHNDYLIPNGYQSNSPKRGTSFGRVSAPVKHYFYIQATGQCKPEITIVDVTIDNEEFVSSNTDTSFSITYSARFKAEGDVSIKFSNDSLYTFIVRGDQTTKETCATTTLNPDPILEGDDIVVHSEFELDSSQIIAFILNEANSTSFNLRLQDSILKKNEVLDFTIDTDTLQSGSYKLTYIITSPGFNCPLVENYSFTIEEVTSINETFTSNCNFQSYPNPVTQTLTVETCGAGVTSGKIKLLNTQGQVQYVQTFSQSGAIQLDVSRLNGGLYILQLESLTGENKVVGKVVVNRP